MTYKNNFDLLRLVAALQVATMHAAEWLRLRLHDDVLWLLSLFPGVPIFFVISGYLIAASLDADSSPDYFRKRVLRIYPALWISLLCVLIIMLCAGVMIPSSALYYVKYFASLALVGLPMPEAPDHFRWNEHIAFFPNGVLWTISVELGFYFIAFVLFCKSLRSSGGLVVSAMGVAAAASLICQGFQQTTWHRIEVELTSPPYLWIFLIGSTLYFARRLVSPVIHGKGLLWLSGYLAFSWYFGVAPDYKRLTPLIVLQIGLLGCTAISLAFTCRRAAQVLRRNDLSYGIYLYHMPIIMLFRWSGVYSSALLWPLFFSFAFAVAWLSWRLVERPALSLKRDKIGVQGSKNCTQLEKA